MARKRVSLLIAATALAAALMLGVIALPAQAALRHIDGTVVSKDAAGKTFRIATQGGNQLRIKVDSSTKFDRLAGFGALHKGLAVEVEAKTTGSGLVALQVEPRQSGGGGGHDGGGGTDDGPNHT